ncbi:MAG TPA: OmpH family outer membrane protein, partial [Flavobacterium sp.]
MKKILLVIAMAFAVISCDKTTTSETKEAKTAYVDTSKLLEEYAEAKDIDAKYKAKSEQMGKQLESEVAKFKAEAG